MSDSLVKKMRHFGSIKRIALNYTGGLFLAFWIAPYLSAFAVKHGIKPNQLTRYMIPMAMTGSLLFVVPDIWVKIVGAFCIHLFYLFDLSDGQVARATGVFSLYGEQIDHIAHHCSHFFLLLSIIINLIQFERYSIVIVLFLGGGMLFAEYFYRNICSISTEVQLIDKYEGRNKPVVQKTSNVITKSIALVKAILFMFRCADNYVLFASVLYFVDFFCETDIVFGLSFLFIFSSLLKNVCVIFYLIRHTMFEE